MLVGDSLVSGEFLDASELDLDSLEDEDDLVVNDRKDKDEDEKEIAESVSVGGDAFDSIEGVSLDRVSKLASDSLSNSYFLSHSELRINDLKFGILMFA